MLEQLEKRETRKWFSDYRYGSVFVFLILFSRGVRGTRFQSILQSHAPRAYPSSSPPPWGIISYVLPFMTSIIGTVQMVLYCVDDGSKDEIKGMDGPTYLYKCMGKEKKKHLE